MNLEWVNGVNNYLLRNTDTSRVVAMVSKGPRWGIHVKDAHRGAPITSIPHKETSLADTKALAESLVRMRHGG